MAYTFLEAVNAALEEAKVISSDSELTTFTSSGIQHQIDLMIGSWNDVLRELYRAAVWSGETAEGTITLVAGTTEYDFASDFEVMVGEPIDKTNNTYLTQYPGGYLALRVDRPNLADYTGLPTQWCENPTTKKMILDVTPTSDEAGRVYTYVYEKRHNLSATTDTFPFSDTVVDAIRPAVAQVFDRKWKKEFDAGIFSVAISQAAHVLRRSAQRNTYGRFRGTSR